MKNIDAASDIRINTLESVHARLSRFNFISTCDHCDV